MSSEVIVHPSEIESKLSQIWETLQGAGKMRACLFNLIIYTKKNPRMDYLFQISQKLIEKFPSRIMFITIDEDSQEPVLKTSVSVVSVGEGEGSIACDFINIILSKHNEERAKFLLLPHILPDLPVYLVWADDPQNNAMLASELEKLSTRVIFDSESTNNLINFTNSLLNHNENLGSDIADLNWARIEGWRHLLIDTFKSLDKIDQLKELKQIQMSYNCKETEFFCHTKIQALYLQGWIATQLGWEYQNCEEINKGFHLVYKNQNDTVDVILTPESDKDLAPGRIISLQMTTKNQDDYYFSRCSDKPHVVNVKHSTPDLCDLPSQFVFDRYESGQSLIKEIFHQKTSSHYLALLHKLQKLPQEALKI